jgi:hypothetical protein
MCRNLEVFKDFFENFGEKIAVLFCSKTHWILWQKISETLQHVKIRNPKKKSLLTTYKHDMGAISRIKKTWKKTKMPFWNAGKAHSIMSADSRTCHRELAVFAQIFYYFKNLSDSLNWIFQK